MGWFWSDSQGAKTPPQASAPRHDGKPPPACPMHSSAVSQPPPTSTPPSCPVRSKPQTGTLSKLNPLNYMPTLSQDRAPNQTVLLPTSRETSSIPRGDAAANWEYPSPQQMYNALLRKGFDDTPANAIESMVAVHNFLNEGAWEEIVGWERRFAGGLRQGWDNCIEGEERFEQKRAVEDRRALQEPRLARLQGRPQDFTPKARIMQLLGWAYPKHYSSEPPFDRHDWFVHRVQPDGTTKELRYVIDYYSGPPEPTGEPVFYLDVRPAVDSPTAAAERLMRWGGDLWYRASGGTTRLRDAES